MIDGNADTAVSKAPGKSGAFFVSAIGDAVRHLIRDRCNLWLPAGRRRSSNASFYMRQVLGFSEPRPILRKHVRGGVYRAR